MRPLFEFNDAFVAAAAYGDSDDDLYALFEDAFEEVESEIQDELLRRTGRKYETVRDDEGVHIQLTEAETRDEFGDRTHQMRPVIRPALVAAAHKAKLRAEKVLDV